ncbi:MAG: glycosyltransferase [bacterium]|nr:glycosyltransferase [bacterium]
MRRRKILFLITKATWGGAQRYVYDLATALRNEFEISVAFGQEGLLAKKLQEAHVATFPIHTLQRDVSISNDVKSFFELLRLFRSEKPDVVHLNSSKAAGVGALAARLAGVPRIVFTAHGWPFWEQRNPVSRSLIYLFSWLTALLSDKTIVVSDYDLRIARSMPFSRHKLIRIYNGIDPNFSTELQSGGFVREYFPKGVHITGTIGELNRNKNQIALIEQARKNPNMYVAICGDGENRLFLKRKIEEYKLDKRVLLFGFVEPRMVLKGFDTFALPSIKEGLPYVLLEAKVAGLPIIANRVGGVGEILDAKDLQEFSLEKMVKQTAQLY